MMQGFEPFSRLDEGVMIFLPVKAGDEPNQQGLFGDLEFLTYRAPGSRVGFECGKVKSIGNDLHLAGRVSEFYMLLPGCFRVANDTFRQPMRH